ncbi:MAG: hypothetical protein IT305_07575 [Chloroflexi bacterium]|nr:hypothetical protein [Chloroflexota bacterium]
MFEVLLLGVAETIVLRSIPIASKIVVRSVRRVVSLGLRQTLGKSPSIRAASSWCAELAESGQFGVHRLAFQR